MVAVEEKTEGLDAHGTAGSTLIPRTALSIALLLAQYSFPLVAINEGLIELHGTEATHSRDLSSEIGSLDLFGRINRVYDELLKNQVDLDVDSKRVLYRNLWNLYT